MSRYRLRSFSRGGTLILSASISRQYGLTIEAPQFRRDLRFLSVSLMPPKGVS
jgi:hypothetical protein